MSPVSSGVATAQEQRICSRMAANDPIIIIFEILQVLGPLHRLDLLQGPPGD